MKYLVIGPAWVGDMIMAQVLFKKLKKQDHDATIDVVTPSWGGAILRHMPEVSRSIALEVAHGEVGIGKRFCLGRSLRTMRYDQAFVLPNSFKSALVPFWASIPCRTGWRGESRYFLLNDMRILDKLRYPRMVDRFAALAYPKHYSGDIDIALPQLKTTDTLRHAHLRKFSLSLEKPVLGICPGAEYGISKRWLPSYYAAVIQHFVAEGWQSWIFGSAKDSVTSAEIRAHLPQHSADNVYDMTGKTQLDEVISLLSCSTVVVSNDSGLMHIAAALQRRVIVIYGSSSPDFTPPLHHDSAIVRLGLSCSPCFQRSCPFGHMNCMKELEPERIIEAVHAFNIP